MNTDKLYCYVDETGQDTKGELFIVSVVITEKDRDEIVTLLEQLERETGKKATKWNKTKRAVKQKYIEAVLMRKILRGRIFYSLFQSTKAYEELTVITIASAVNMVKTKENYKASVFIDGLKDSEVARVGKKLRTIGVRTEKVRGVRDESHAMIRLADALAGFIREYSEGEKYAKKFYKLGIEKKTLIKV